VLLPVSLFYGWINGLGHFLTDQAAQDAPGHGAQDSTDGTCRRTTCGSGHYSTSSGSRTQGHTCRTAAECGAHAGSYWMSTWFAAYRILVALDSFLFFAFFNRHGSPLSTSKSVEHISE
jgi:hypothetical protein